MARTGGAFGVGWSGVLAIQQLLAREAVVHTGSVAEMRISGVLDESLDSSEPIRGFPDTVRAARLALGGMKGARTFDVLDMADTADATSDGCCAGC